MVVNHEPQLGAAGTRMAELTARPRHTPTTPIAQRQESVLCGTQLSGGHASSPGVSSAREVGELSFVSGGFPVVPIVGGLVIVAVVALIVWAVRASAKPK